MKGLYHFSPAAINNDNWGDMMIQKEAWITAFNQIDIVLPDKFNQAPEGFDAVSFRIEIAQYIVDGHLPDIDKHNDSIVEFGEWVKLNSDQNLDTKKKRKSDR
ncbi:MAG: hypothetical protein PF541_00045 [Prolixibacteraceae bacterium]|jgi:hypothetical protein|nr:hypothetical protein [Prolixibacteraceae bacterium]